MRHWTTCCLVYRTSLFEMFQWGFRAFQRTETAFVKVTDDLLRGWHNRLVSKLVVLGNSAAFDTAMSLHVAELKGAMLGWFSSHLWDTFWCVHAQNAFSSYSGVRLYVHAFKIKISWGRWDGIVIAWVVRNLEWAWSMNCGQKSLDSTKEQMRRWRSMKDMLLNA